MENDYEQRSSNPDAPEQLPLQRIHLIADLPPQPESLICTCAFGKDLPEGFLPAEMPLEDLPLEYQPTEMPRTAKYLAMVEWAWTPMNNRLDAYYLSTNRQRTHWLLWARGLNEAGSSLCPPKDAALYAYCSKTGIKPADAAIFLLMAGWRFEAKHMYLNRYNFISDTGLLSVSMLEAIAHEVWGRETCR